MVNPQQADWIRVTKRRPCPICGKDKWCSFQGPDDSPTVVLCMREATGSDREISTKNGTGYLHRLRDDDWRPPPPRSNSSGQQRNGKSYFTSGECIEAVRKRWESQGYRPGGQWCYRDAAGAEVLHVLRFDPADGSGAKQILPVSRIGSTWQNKHLQTVRPLYGLPDLAAADSVLVVEGEKCAEACRSIGMVATTSSGGSSAGHVDKTDWQPLAGKRVVIVPDNDEKGREYAATVAGILRRLKPRPQIKTLQLPDLPAGGGDIADWLDSRDAAEPDQLRETILDLAARTPAEGPKVQFPTITARELDSAVFEIRYLIEGLLAADHPCIVSGASKTLKTSILIDLAISLATGGHFLGYFPAADAVRVGIMSGESGMPTIQDTSRRIADAARRSLAEIEGLVFTDRLPQFGDPDHLEGLRHWIETNGLQVVIVDPAYLCIETDGRENSIFGMGPKLRPIAELCGELGATWILAHHTTQASVRDAGPPKLSDMAWAGFEQFFRQWLQLKRFRDYEHGSGEHHLWLAAGGSMGHTSLNGLEIFEGTIESGRRWEVNVIPSDEVATGSRRVSAEERDQEHERRLRAALLQAPNGETLRQLRELAGLDNRTAGPALTRLLAAGRAEECEIKKHTRTERGYRPTEHT